MASETDLKIEKLTKEFQHLVQYVTDENSQSRTAYEVESKLFRELLRFGKELLTLFFTKSSDSTSQAGSSN